MALISSFATWKYLLLVVNCFISMIDVSLMSGGIVALGGAGSLLGGYYITIMGSVVMVLSFMGCFAPLRESYMLSIIYVFLAVFTILSQIIFMIGFAIMKETLTDMCVKRIDDMWAQRAEIPSIMDKVQTQYYCCGRDSPQDYLANTTDVLPKSCCAYNDCSVDKNIFPKGCSITLVNFFDAHGDQLMLILVGLIALELLGALSAYFLAQHVRRQIQVRKSPMHNGKSESEPLSK